MALESVTFQFTSPQFVFESGRILFFKGARMRSDGEWQDGELKNGAIHDVLVEGPIEFDAMLAALDVVRRTDRRRFHIAGQAVSRAITQQHLLAQRVDVVLDLPLVVRFRVEDSAGRAVPNALVNFGVPNTYPTYEITTGESGEIALFGAPGEYRATVAAVDGRWLEARPSVRVEFSSRDEGERVVVVPV